MSDSVSLWRIARVTLDFETTDMSGKGGERFRGRWSEKGTPMVYAASTRALACLETIVHLTQGVELPMNRYLVEILVPRDAWEAAEHAPRTVGWDAQPEGRVSMRWGTAWAQSGRSLLARVPSVIVPEEENVLINPRHPHLGRLAVTKVRKWLYDSRLPP